MRQLGMRGVMLGNVGRTATNYNQATNPLDSVNRRLRGTQGWRSVAFVIGVFARLIVCSDWRGALGA